MTKSGTCLYMRFVAPTENEQAESPQTPTSPSSTPVERVVGQRYSLTTRIAIGGMGEVWAATDTVLGRQVAVKILRDDLVDSGVFLERFRAEARHTAALTHPGIARVFDYGEDIHNQRHVAYLVMELVPGRPLSTVLAEKRTLPLESALSLLAQTAEALHAAHVSGVVHRDVKPGNILLLDDGTIKVTDFGIARAADSVSLTEVGQVVGTAQYISPEQAMAAEATPASDIYSLGVIGYEMLAGRPPFTAGNAGALAMAHAHQAPPELPPSVPIAIRTTIAQALSKNPGDRPADARQFAATLRRLQLANLPAPGGVPEAAERGDNTLADASASDMQAATRLMAVEDLSQTAIMPPGVPMRSAPSLGVSEQAHVSRHQRRWVAATVLAVVAIIAGIALLPDSDGPGPLDPRITATTGLAVSFVDLDESQLVGQSLADASAVLSQAGLVAATRSVNLAGIPDGVVTSVEPSGQVAVGSTVTLDVNTATTVAPTTSEPEPKDKGNGNGNGNGKPKD